MTTSQPTTPPPSPPAAKPPEGYTIENFMGNPLGKLFVGVLTPLSRVTIRKSKDAQGKVVEKTPLDAPGSTVVAGVVLLIITVIAIRIAAIVS